MILLNWKVLKSQKVTNHVVAMEIVAEQHILTKCSKFNTFQVIRDLLNDFILKIHRIIVKKDPGLTLTQGNLLVA